MFEDYGRLKTGFLLFCLVVLGASFSGAEEQTDRTGPAKAIEGIWDPAKYISIDEVRPGMEAYCLTTFEGVEVEKFGLEVLSVVRDMMPGKDAILVQGTDERFIHTGPVGGCSGSPVYIEGRLAGALAFGWTYSKDPLYGVTPIEEMLRTGQSQGKKLQTDVGYVFDFSKPIDFVEINRQITTPRLSRASNPAGASPLPCPLVTSGLPAEVCEELNTLVEPFGLMVVSGVGVGGSYLEQDTSKKLQDVKLVPGACLALPLVTGDIKLSTVGTVTEVLGDEVYGFGHSYLGYGAVDLPMATGQVHTVVSSVIRSFKLATALEIVGALTTDESTAVYGRIGAKARMIPLTVRVDRYNDVEKRAYNCRIVDNRLLTPSLLSTVLRGAVLMYGKLPPDHFIEYKVSIGVEGFDSIAFENVSTSLGLAEMAMESSSPVAMLMNNPYEEVDIKSVDVDVRVVPKSIISHIWSVDLSDSKVKAGQEVEVGVVVESFLAEKRKYRFSLAIPDELAPGRYELIVSGSYGYEQFLRKAVPYRFISQNLPSLIEALNNLLQIGRDKLYCLLVLPARGVAVEKAELPDLPATKALVLQDGKRTLRAQPYSRWLEESLDTGTVVIDKKSMQIIVEK
jgi:hypothetical protein